MHIETVNITVGVNPTILTQALIGALLKGELGQPIDAAEQPTTGVSTSQAPKIGEAWPGQDGIYAGVSRGLERHLEKTVRHTGACCVSR